MLGFLARKEKPASALRAPAGSKQGDRVLGDQMRKNFRVGLQAETVGTVRRVRAMLRVANYQG
jgi:hypothetical protein